MNGMAVAAAAGMNAAAGMEQGSARRITISKKFGRAPVLRVRGCFETRVDPKTLRFVFLTRRDQFELSSDCEHQSLRPRSRNSG
jgi:hypothetical protein